MVWVRYILWSVLFGVLFVSMALAIDHFTSSKLWAVIVALVVGRLLGELVPENRPWKSS